MKTTEKNGYKISEFTLGTVQLGMAYGINNSRGMPSSEEAEKILSRAVSGGIVSFDTARGYDKSEKILGDFFRGKDICKTLITKVEFEDETKADLRASLFAKTEDSIKKLGVESIPLLHLHTEKYLETYGEALTSALSELKAEGLVKSVGISFSDKSRLLELCDTDIFDSIQIPANMFDNEEIRNGKISKLSSLGVAVYVRSVYLQGLFFKDPEELTGNLVSAKGALTKLRRLAEENNMSMASLALSYMRGVEGITSLVIGCETEAQLDDSLNLFENPPLGEELVSRINEISEEVESVILRPWEWKK